MSDPANSNWVSCPECGSDDAYAIPYYDGFILMTCPDCGEEERL